MREHPKKIRIGQIGLGHSHGEGKMLAVRKFPELFEVVGYAEPNDEWVEKRGHSQAYADLPRLSVEELIETCDAILVESEISDLTKYAAMCVQAGKHIHMDKPVWGTAAEWGEILEIASRQKLVVQMGYMYRYNPAVLKCMDMVKHQKLGEIFSIHGEISTQDYPDTKRRYAEFPTGPLYIMGSHLIDLIVYILGEPDKVNTFLKSTGMDDIHYADNNLAVLEFEKALATVRVSSVEVNGWGRRQFVVAGSRGTVEIKPMENKTTMTYSDDEISVKHYEDMKQEIPIVDVPKNERYDEMVKAFYRYIIGEEENPFSYEHDLLVHKVITEICKKA